MGGFELHRAHHANGGVDAPLVVPVDPAGGRVFDVRDRLVRPVVEERRADALGLEQAVDRFDERVVVRVADRADRGADPFLDEVLSSRIEVYCVPASEW